MLPRFVKNTENQTMANKKHKITKKDKITKHKISSFPEAQKGDCYHNSVMRVTIPFVKLAGSRAKTAALLAIMAKPPLLQSHENKHFFLQGIFSCSSEHVYKVIVVTGVTFWFRSNPKKWMWIKCWTFIENMMLAVRQLIQHVRIIRICEKENYMWEWW